MNNNPLIPRITFICFLFFSMNVMSELNLRCKMVKICENNSRCTTSVAESYKSIYYKDGWFSNTYIINDNDYSDTAKFNKNTITADLFANEAVITTLNLSSLIYKVKGYLGGATRKSRINPKKTFHTLTEEWLCSKI